MLGLAAGTAERRLDVMLKSIGPAAEALYVLAERENATMAAHDPEARAGMAGELACLRVIRFTVIADMVKMMSR